MGSGPRDGVDDAEDGLDQQAHVAPAAGVDLEHRHAGLADLRAGSPLDDALLEKTAWHIARVRSQPEAREGLSAFLDKRPPGWLPAKKP